MNTMRRLLYVLLTAAATLLAGCNGECYDNRNALPLATFALADGSAVRVDSLRVTGVGVPNDSVLWNGESPAAELYLPFRVDSDTTQYLFELLPLHLRDTVTFIYTRNPVFASYECGVSYVYEISRISSTGAFIDSVSCPEGRITNANVSNLIIYLRDE